MSCLTGCGKLNTPESVFKRFIQSATTGDVVGYWESTYSIDESIVSQNPAELNESQKKVFEAVILNLAKEMHLDGLRYLSTTMDGENIAKVLAVSEAAKVTMSFICRKIDDKWKISSDVDDMNVVVEDVMSTSSVSRGATTAVQKLIDASKKSKLTNEMIQSSFDCTKEQSDGIVEFLKIFDYKNVPDYKNASEQEKAEIEKEVNGMGIRSSNMSALEGYVIVSLGSKDA